MYYYKDDKCDTFKELTSSGGIIRPRRQANVRVITMEGNYLSPIIDAFKPILIFAAVLWGIEIIITMLIKDHKKATITFLSMFLLNCILANACGFRQSRDICPSLRPDPVSSM